MELQNFVNARRKSNNRLAPIKSYEQFDNILTLQDILQPVIRLLTVSVREMLQLVLRS